VSLMTDWVKVNGTPGHADGTPVVNPLTVSNTSLYPLTVNGLSTQIKVCLRYTTASAPSNGATVLIQVFGADGGSSNGATTVPQRLVDGLGNHLQTLTVDTTNDAQDGTYSYTMPVTLDMQANQKVYVCVNTILGSGAAGAALMARVL
ncbi:MAG: hypothetical protein KGL39_42465, partial [Patescibacteria group bacterium]|nr:hypothetical protein [Patescibacteria group bacterium]